MYFVTIKQVFERINDRSLLAGNEPLCAARRETTTFVKNEVKRERETNEISDRAEEERKFVSSGRWPR